MASPERQASSPGDNPRADVQAFLRKLLEESGYESQAEWGRAAGIGPDRMSDYLRGESAPDGVNFLKLLSAAGVPLAMEVAPTPNPLAALEAVCAELAQNQQAFLSQLDAQGQALARIERSLAAGRAHEAQ